VLFGLLPPVVLFQKELSSEEKTMVKDLLLAELNTKEL
jgi:hypothetical protein